MGFSIKPEEAAKLLNLTGQITTDKINAAFKLMALAYHPDVNPSDTAHQMMQSLNEARSVLLSTPDFNFVPDAENDEPMLGERLNAAISKLESVPGLTLEISGTWLWVWGSDESHNELMKEAGLKRHSKEKLFNGEYQRVWYLGENRKGKRRYRGRPMGQDRIRSIYGSNRRSQKERNRLN